MMKKNIIEDNNENLVFINSSGENGTPGNVLYANKTACEKLGYSLNEIHSLHPHEIGMPINIAYVSEEVIKLFSGKEKAIYYDMLFFCKSSQVILTKTKVELCEFNGNAAVMTTAKEINNHNYIRNIVNECNNELETKVLQINKTKEQLIQQEKLALMGQLAAGVAHEINNPLGYISSNIETSHKYLLKIRETLSSYEVLFSKLNNISKEELNLEISKINDLNSKYNLEFMMKDIVDIYNDVEYGLKKISEIVTNLKSFSRVDTSNEISKYDLNKGIKETLIVARNEIKYISRVEESLGNIPTIMANGNRINEVLLNIILNSCYAIKNKKTKDQGIIKISTSVENKYVICQIEDNGIGISEEHINNIFNPFFTTKPVGDGTGLGLSIAYDIIVNKHNGEIFAESIPQLGTKITIKLPINNKEINPKL